MENLDIIVLIVVSIVIICIGSHFVFSNETENMRNIKKHVMYRIGSGSGSGSGCNCRSREHYTSDDDYDNAYNDGYGPPVLGPWWNSTRFNRNSSWDIRGDVPVNHVYVGPWLVSPLI
jgi:hypothetical protein